MYKIFFDGDDLEYTDFLFKTKDDAEFFLTFDDVSSFNLVIKEVPVFSKKFWYTLTPYVFWFDEDGGIAVGKIANPINVYGMMDSQFSIQKFVKGKHVMVAFWDSTKDMDRATTIAKSLYEGWKAGKNGKI